MFNVYSKKYEKPERRKRSSYQAFFFSFFELFVRHCGCTNMTKIIKHEIACYISYVNHQLFKDAAVYLQQ